MNWMIAGKSTVQNKYALTFVSIALMLLSTVFFVASEVAQLTMRAELQSLLIVTLSLSAASLVLGYIVSRLSKKTSNENLLAVYDKLWQRGPEVRSTVSGSIFMNNSWNREEQ